VKHLLTRDGLKQLLKDFNGYGVHTSKPTGTDYTVGSRYKASNTPYVWYFNGTIWKPHVYGYPVTEPVDGDFSWVNQVSANVSTAFGGVMMSAPLSSSANFRCRVKAAPATPYTITVMFNVTSRHPGSGNPWVATLLFRESGSGKLSTIYHVWSPSEMPNPDVVTQVSNWNSPTSFNANPATYGSVRTGNPYWLRISDDGSNRDYSMSGDGYNFVSVYSIGCTTFLTADQVGFGLDNETNDSTLYMHLLDWTEA
jgi:hypothetical protein